jgi:dual specificity tyrosine-phosphorylation-regulated kinase 1
MVPEDMLLRADEQHRRQFFEQKEGRWTIKQKPPDAAAASTYRPSTPIVPSGNPIASLKDVVEKEASRKKKYSSSDAEMAARQNSLFVDLIYRMLAFKPTDRIRPDQALEHPFITER